MNDRTRSAYANQTEQREQVAVALATERLPWHPAIGERFGIERSDWRALVEAVFPAAKTSEGVILALSYCKARKLDPFKRVVHVVPIWSKEKRAYIETVWPGIGEARTTAMRTKLFAGCDDTKFGPDIEKAWTIASDDDDRGGGKQERQITIIFPEWAQVTVYRKMGDERWGIPGPRVYWLETYATRGRSIVPNDMWIKRPRGQLEKCAEAAALRRAFPEELGDEATADEMGDYSGMVIDPDGNEVVTATKASTNAAQSAPSDRPARTENRAQPTATQRTQRTTPPTNTPAATTPPSQTKPPVTPVQDNPDDWRTGHGETTRDPKTVTPPAETRREPDKRPANDTPAQTNTVTTATSVQQEDPGFEAWVVDEHGAETTVDPFNDPMRWAAALGEALAGKGPTVVEDILRLNEGAIGDCCDADENVAKVIEAMIDEARRPQTQQQTAQQADPVVEVDPSALVRVLEMPRTPKGGEHWPNYVTDMKKVLDESRTVEEADAWLAANKPTFFGKNIKAETDITRHHAAVVAKLSGAEPRDPDRDRLEIFTQEINAYTDVEALKQMSGRMDVMTVLNRWDRDRPELANAMREAAVAKMKALLGRT